MFINAVCLLYRINTTTSEANETGKSWQHQLSRKYKYVQCFPILRLTCRQFLICTFCFHKINSFIYIVLFNIVHKLYSGRGSQAQSKKGKTMNSPRQNKRPTLTAGQPFYITLICWFSFQKINSFIYSMLSFIFMQVGEASRVKRGWHWRHQVRRKIGNWPFKNVNDWLMLINV